MKHRKRYKEETFTEEEMKRFVKFNSLEEQREFNKKIFCKSKKATKEKKEQQSQKPKGKSSKQLKAEEWKRQKEISKIAEEIEMKRKQQEEKLEQAKELSLKKNKEDNNSDRPLLQDASGQPPKKLNSSSVHKAKSKKRKKRGKAKNGSKVTEDYANKSCQQPEMPPVSVTRKASETRVSHTKPKEPVQTKKTSNTKISSSSSRNVSKSVTAPVSVAPQPPNVWQKRMATQYEIQQILPSNEEEEFKQLQMALEMSRNLAEIEKQQKQIAALQEELKLISLEKNFKLYLSESGSDEESKEFDSISLGVNATGQDDSPGFCNHGNKNQEQNIATGGKNDSSNFPQNAPNSTCELKSDSHSQQTKAQPSTSRSKDSLCQWEDRRVCPYGRNCCLGKRCKKFHPSSKRSEMPVENRIQGSNMKNVITCHELESEFLNDSKNCDQEEPGNLKTTTALLSEDWDNDIDNSVWDDKFNEKMAPDTSAVNICPSKVPCVVQNHLSEDWDFQNEEEELNTDYSSSDLEYGDNAPLSSKEFDMTRAATENWDNELKENEQSSNNAMEMRSQCGNKIASSTQNIEENNFHPHRRINEVGQAFKTEREIHCVPNGSHSGFTEGIGQKSAGIPGDYMPTYPVIAHPVVNTSLNGGSGPAQPSVPVFGMDILSGISPTGHLSQTNQIINPVNCSTAGQAPAMTGSLASQNPVLPPSGTTLFSTVSGQGVFHPGNILHGNCVHSGAKGPSHVQIPGPALSSGTYLSKSEKSISGNVHQTCPQTVAQTTSQAKATTLSECNIAQGSNQAYEPQNWSNACLVNPTNPSQSGSNLPTPGFSIPMLQNMNPMLSLFPGLPLPQQNTVPNTFTSLSTPKVQNPALMGLPCGVPTANGNVNYVSLMALEAQYLNMLQLQSSSMTTNQQVNPCEDSAQGDLCINQSALEKHTNNNGSHIRKPVTVPKVLSFVKSQS